MNLDNGAGDNLIEERFFVDHGDDFIDKIIDKAAAIPQKVNEFTLVLRSIILPEPKVSLGLCLLASFMIGIFAGDADLNPVNELCDLMFYGGELI